MLAAAVLLIAATATLANAQLPSGGITAIINAHNVFVLSNPKLRRAQEIALTIRDCDAGCASRMASTRC